MLSVLCPMLSVHSALENVYYYVWTNSMYFEVCPVKCTACSVQCAVCNMKSKSCSLQPAVCSVLCFLWCFTVFRPEQPGAWFVRGHKLSGFTRRRGRLDGRYLALLMLLQLRRQLSDSGKHLQQEVVV